MTKSDATNRKSKVANRLKDAKDSLAMAERERDKISAELKDTTDQISLQVHFGFCFYLSHD